MPRNLVVPESRILINIHGTEAGGGASFPIGISQLYPGYTQDAGYLAGSDHYLGDFDGGNAADLYLMNAFMEAVNLPDQPLASFEFEAGSGDYSQGMGRRNDPSAADFKIRMSVAQGNRLINYYLFTGGINYRMDITPATATTGSASPVNGMGRARRSIPRAERVTPCRDWREPITCSRHSRNSSRLQVRSAMTSSWGSYRTRS